MTHEDLFIKLNNANKNRFLYFKKAVFDFYSDLVYNCGNYNVPNFLQLISDYERFLDKIELDFRLLIQEIISVPDENIISVDCYIDEVLFIIQNQVYELEKLHKLITGSSSYIRIYRTNSKTDRLRQQIASEAIIIGSRMRFCLKLLNTKP